MTPSSSTLTGVVQPESGFRNSQSEGFGNFTRPRLLDLYCGQGGAAAGYMQAGFDVTGIDNNPDHARRYPARFIEADALAYVAEHGHHYDVIHASPPCQGYSRATVGRADRDRYPLEIPQVRAALVATGALYIIENVEGAAADLIDPVLLCGSMFGLEAVEPDGTRLRLERHRLFECNFTVTAPPHLHDMNIEVAGAYKGGSSDRMRAKHRPPALRRGGFVPNAAMIAQLLQVDWMTLAGMYEAIPPAYASFIGKVLLRA